MVSLPDGEKISKICLFVLTWSTNVTDRRTLRDSKDRAYAFASRGKNGFAFPLPRRANWAIIQAELFFVFYDAIPLPFFTARYDA